MERAHKTTTLPPFTDEGVLPPGTYGMTVGRLRQSMLVRGPSEGMKSWNRKWRRQLVENLGRVVGVLRFAQIEGIYVDGSFVEDKDEPGDIDVYFECDRMAWATNALQMRLFSLGIASGMTLTWDSTRRLVDPGTGVKHLPLWHELRVDLFPHYGQSCGILDARGNALIFPSAFRMRRDGTEKGIIKIL